MWTSFELVASDGRLGGKTGITRSGWRRRKKKKRSRVARECKMMGKREKKSWAVRTARFKKKRDNRA